MKPLHRLIVVLVAGALVGSAAASIVHRVLTSECREPDQREGQRRSPLARTGFTTGMPLGGMMLTSPDGRREELLSVVRDSEQTFLHFVDRECVPCMSDLQMWVDTAEVAPTPVLFVACNEPIPVHQLDGLTDQPGNLYTLLSRDHGTGGPRAVPATIVVDRQATVVGNVPGIREFMALARGVPTR